MAAVILDGKATAATIRAELGERVAALKDAGVTPGLGTVLVGDDPRKPRHRRRKHRGALRSASTPSAWTCRRQPASRRSKQRCET